MSTELQEVRIATADLAVGMFVCRLDRPWEGTPFPLQYVEVEGEGELAALRRLCRFVYIDRSRELQGGYRRLLTLPRVERPVRASGATVDQRFRRSGEYADQVTVHDELPRARDALQATSVLLDRIYDDIASGRVLSVAYVEQIVRPLVASVLRNADAFLFLEGMRRHDNYTYSHAISCGAPAAALGRHLGLPESTILALATGGLLMDIGKVRIPEALLRFAGKL